MPEEVHLLQRSVTDAAQDAGFTPPQFETSDDAAHTTGRLGDLASTVAACRDLMMETIDTRIGASVCLDFGDVFYTIYLNAKEVVTQASSMQAKMEYAPHAEELRKSGVSLRDSLYSLSKLAKFSETDPSAIPLLGPSLNMVRDGFDIFSRCLDLLAKIEGRDILR